MIKPHIGILKSVWSRAANGQWAIADLKGIELRPQTGFQSNFFAVESQLELMTSRPSGNITELMASFGPTDFLLKQSIAPVVSWRDGDNYIRIIGTASVISCTGYAITAAHVLMDPFEGDYSSVKFNKNQNIVDDNFNFGVLIPTGPGYGVKGFIYFPFEKYWVWGKWLESPLFHERDRFDYLTDLAICKIPNMPNDAAHQPLSLSLNAFLPSETAYSIGYAEMDDIPVEYGERGMIIPDFKADLYVSVGEVMRVFPENHLDREVPTPGPCFDFRAKIPGKMSGAPVFGAEGAVVRGVISRSFSGEQHAYGAMVGPAMHLSLNEPQVSGRTLKALMESGQEGIARIHGAGL